MSKQGVRRELQKRSKGQMEDGRTIKVLSDSHLYLDPPLFKQYPESTMPLQDEKLG